MEDVDFEERLDSLTERVKREGAKAVTEQLMGSARAVAPASAKVPSAGVSQPPAPPVAVPPFALESDGRIMLGPAWRGSLDQLEDLLSDPACLSALSGVAVKDGLNFNELSKMIEADRRPLDEDLTTFALRIRGASGRLLYRIGYDKDEAPTEKPVDLKQPKDVEDALELGARRPGRTYHPVRDYLSRLPPWDGTQRLEAALDLIFQKPGYVRPPESQVARRFLPMWMISAVARAMNPGCKADCALVIFGTTQGQGKSEFFARIVPDRGWYSCDDIQMGGDRDSYLVVHQKFVVELAELATLNKAEVEKVKSFMSRAQDTFRAPYARTSKPHCRGFVFGGTTNKPDMLRDVENRRFWIYECDPACQGDMTWLDANRDQLWAEALAEYRRNAKWWPEGDVASAIRQLNADYRQAVDVMEDDILAAAKALTPGFKERDVVEALLSAPAGVPGFDREQRDHKVLYERIKRVLLSHGWSRTSGGTTKRIGGKVIRGYYRIASGSSAGEAASPPAAVASVTQG